MIFVEQEGITNIAADTIADESEVPVTEFEGDQTHIHEIKNQHDEDEILEDEADKEVILQENVPGLLPKEAEEPGHSASSFNDDGTADIKGKEALKEALQEDKDRQEEAGDITEKIVASEVLVQPHDNPGEEPEHVPGDAVLSTLIVNDERIASLTIQKEKEEKKDNIEPEEVINDTENNQPKSDDNVEEKGTAPEVVVLKDAQVQPDEQLNETEGYEKLPSTLNNEEAEIPEDQKKPEEVEEKISVENQPEEDDTVTDIKTAEDAVLKQDEEKEGKKEIIQLSNESEETVQGEHISYQIPELRNEEVSSEIAKLL